MRNLILNLFLFMMLFLLLLYPVTWDKCKSLYVDTCRQFDLANTEEVHWKFIKMFGAGLYALLLALVSSFFEIVKSEVIGKEKLDVDVNSPEGRFTSYSKALQGVMLTDWKSDSTFNEDVEGWSWVEGYDLRIHFRQMPEEKTRLRLQKRLESYGTHSGWVVESLSDVYLHNFGDKSRCLFKYLLLI